jgi:hypothetical protein
VTVVEAHTSARSRGAAAGLVIEAAVDAYVAALPAGTRKALEELRGVRMGAGR